MYAIITCGGKQHKAVVGAYLHVEKINAELKTVIKLPVDMLVDGDAVKRGGEIANSYVEAEVTGHGKEKKIIIYKYKAKKTYRKKQGHRQPYTTIKVVNIIA